MSSTTNDPPQIPGSLRPGDRFGRFQLLERIAKGGMAEVFRVIAPDIPGPERVFVVKRIRPDKTDSPKFVQMFCEEARITALLHHPNIVRVFDFGHIDGAYFMVMEDLVGKDLSTVMRAVRARGSALPPSLAVLVAREVARALHHAHTLELPDGTPAGVVHRDVTPSNIMLLTAGGVKILDFGIAKAAALARRPEAGGPPRLAGKLSYMSPELVRGAAVDHRSDIFSLGVVLWEMVAGERLFKADDESQTLHNVLMQPIAAPSRRRDGIPALLDTIVARAVEREPANRYDTAEAFANELDRFLSEMPTSDQAIPNLFEELSSAAPPASDASSPNSSPIAVVTISEEEAPRPARITGRSALGYPTIAPPQPPQIRLPTLIGIFLMVVAVTVTVGRVVIRFHAPAAGQSSSARSVSTSK
ncbi:MAG TPA: serine/threonine-protein kinase [Polyangia bacterium]|nr:serine/threonine-protein kinase [Polyangia bacterium]